MKPELLSTLRHSNHSLRVMQAALDAEGIDRASFLRDAGVENDWLDPDHLVSGVEEIDLHRAFVRVTRDRPGAWYRVGARYRLMAYGPLGLAVTAAATMERALETLVTFQALTYSLIEYRLVRSGDEMIGLEADEHAVVDDLREFYQERALGSVVRFLADMKPAAVRITAIESVLERPRGWLDLEATLGIPVVFGAPATRWLLSPGAGAEAMPMADELLAATFRRLCARMIDDANQARSFAGRLHAVLAADPQQLPSFPVVAQRLGVAERSLHRRLAREGVSFQALADRVRMERARELLGTTDLSVERIGEMLSFAETASFSRAFKRWTGVSPRHYRAAAAPRA